jgi:hypothetical protein
MLQTSGNGSTASEDTGSLVRLELKAMEYLGGDISACTNRFSFGFKACFILAPKLAFMESLCNAWTTKTSAISSLNPGKNLLGMDMRQLSGSGSDESGSECTSWTADSWNSSAMLADAAGPDSEFLSRFGHSAFQWPFW